MCYKLQVYKVTPKENHLNDTDIADVSRYPQKLQFLSHNVDFKPCFIESFAK